MNIYIYIYIYIYIIYIYYVTYILLWYSPLKNFLEVAIESWPEWDLNLRSLNSVQMLKPTELSGHEFNSLSGPTLYDYSSSISLFSVHVSFRFLSSSVSEVSHR